MAEPRDLAAQWLAEVLAHAGCADSSGWIHGHVDQLAAAILDQPGVQVTRILRPVDGDEGIYIRVPKEAIRG